VVLRYRGTPRPAERQLVLARGVAGTDSGTRLSWMRASLANPRGLAASIEVWVCLDDPTAPLVRVNLGELLTLGGERPLNVAIPPDARVQLLLWLGEAAWPASAGELAVDVD
jgi:hypothetical protein